MPKHLFICRHAEAADPAPGFPDLDRNLTATGIMQARITGNWLQTHYQVQAIMASTARRTRQTAQILAEMVHLLPATILFEENLYNAHPAKIIQAVLQLPDDVDNVVLVGHNPGISMVIEELTGTNPGYLEPANLAVVTFDAGSWQETEITPGKLQEIFRPQ